MNYLSNFTSRDRASYAVIDKTFDANGNPTEPIIAPWYETNPDNTAQVNIGIVAQLANGWHDLQVGTIHFDEHAFVAQNACPHTVQARHDTPAKRTLRKAAAAMSGALGYEAFNLLERGAVIGIYLDMLRTACVHYLSVPKSLTP